MAKIFKCECGNDELFFTKKSAIHTGLYCKKCGRWIKWLNKNEVRLWEARSVDN